ncbi:MAG TPA: dihydrofolate reductase family protein [Bryobacteraceae bacterium]|nr:dihydrofolate reductase family protein [Bryobacteraceae bacterium]
MRPYVVCHMLASVDGKIDGAALKEVTGHGEYEAAGAKLQADGWICGRVTMQQHFAEREPFVPSANIPAGAPVVCVARRASSYAIPVDTLGKLRWSGRDLDGDHLICVSSELVPQDYLSMLREKGISYVVAGAPSVDERGGHINGAFLAADLVDEVSLIVVPGIDGRHEIASVFDGVSPARRAAVPLRLKSVARRPNDSLWIRYEVVR